MPDVGGAFETTHNQRCRERVDLYVQTLGIDIREDVQRTVQILFVGQVDEATDGA